MDDTATNVAFMEKQEQRIAELEAENKQLREWNMIDERESERLREALEDIYHKSRNGYHGRGYTLGTIAKTALTQEGE